MKNYKGGQPSPLWDGDIDFARAVDMMRAAGYRGWISIVSEDGALQEVQEMQERSLHYLKRLLPAERAIPIRT